MTRRLVGAIAGGIVLLTGAWLVLAPFALGFQPSGKDWTDETLTDVWTGIGLGVVGFIALVKDVTALPSLAVAAESPARILVVLAVPVAARSRLA